jgi:hypothetical protein
VASNARRAVQDRQTIAYLGELETGASAVSVPILNEGGILQVSPRDTFAGLTSAGGRGEPDKYYPSGLRTFTRVVPGDDAQARLLVDTLRERGVRRLVVADDRQLAGSSLADRVTRFARPAGVTVVDRRRLDPDGEVPEDLGAGARRRRADAFLYTGVGAGSGRRGAARRATPAPRRPSCLPATISRCCRAWRAGSGRGRAGASSDGVRTRRVRERPLRAALAPPYGRRPAAQAILGTRRCAYVLSAPYGRAGADASSAGGHRAGASSARPPPGEDSSAIRVEGQPVGNAPAARC